MFFYIQPTYVICAIFIFWISEFYVTGQEKSEVPYLCSNLPSKEAVKKFDANETAKYVTFLQDCNEQLMDALHDSKNNLTFLMETLDSQKQKMYRVFTNKVNWTEAAESCAAEGHQLATIRSKEDLDKFKKAVESKGAKFEMIWLGGYDPTNKGRFVWISNDPYKKPEEFTFTYWAQSLGQPRRTCSLEYDECVHSSYSQQWEVVSCSERNYYACEYHSVNLKKLN